MISNQCADTLLFQIKVCETCQHTERNKNLARTVRPIKVDAPWDIVGIDIIGKYMKTFVSAWFFSPGSDACSFFLLLTRAFPGDPARQHQCYGPH